MNNGGRTLSGAPQEITLSGPVTALAAEEFRAADGLTDVAVGAGDSLLRFDGAEGFSNAIVKQSLGGRPENPGSPFV